MHEYLVENENIQASKITNITHTSCILKRPRTLWGPMDRFLGVHELGRERSHNPSFNYP
jgi:hypothetical protein